MLTPGEVAVIQVELILSNVTDQGSGSGVYQNQASASGMASGSTSTDLSDSGTITDANGNGVANDAGEDDPTQFSVGSTIGLAKDVSVSGRDVTFDYYLEVFGSQPISNLSLTENYDAIFGAGNYSVSSAAAFVDDPGTITLSGTFNGSSDEEILAAGSTLAGGDTAQIRVVVNVPSLTNQGSGLGVYSGTALVTGTQPGGTPVSDESTNGTDPDPNGDDDPGGAGESQASGFSVPFDAIVGAALDAQISGNQVTLDISLEAFGSATASNISAAYDLDAVFGAGNYTVSTPPAFINDPGTITLNGGFNGSSSTALFSGGSSLSSTDTARIQLVVNVTNVTDAQGSGIGAYSSQLLVSATDGSGSTVSDLSTTGTEPDPSGNGNPADSGEDEPTQILLFDSSIGLAIASNVITSNVNETLITYIYTIQNLGDLTVSGVSLVHQALTTFGFGNYTTEQGPRLIDGPATLTFNNSFDGLFSPTLITTGSIAPGETIRLSVIFNITNVTDQGNGFGVYSTSLVVAGSDPFRAVSDTSDEGYFTDPNGNGIADEAGENDPTFATIGEEGRIGLAEDFSRNGNDVTFDLYLENLGTTTLQTFDLPKDLDAVFGAGNYSVTTAPSLIDDPGTLTLDPAFDGSASTGIISAGTLAAGATAQIRLVVNVTTLANLGSGFGVYSSQAQVYAQNSSGVVTFDLSDAGVDPDPNGNGNPFEAGENDASSIEFPSARIGVALDASVSGMVVTLDHSLENLGSVVLTNASLPHDLDALFGAGNYTVLTGPAIVGSPRDLVPNSSFNGSGNTQLIASGSLGRGVSETIRITVQVSGLVDSGSGTGVYSAQVTGSASGSFGTVSDLSDAGTNPDPNGNGVADEVGENDATPFTIMDTVAPMIVCPANVTVECGTSTAPVATGMATATDNVDAPGAITIAFSDVTTPGTGQNFTITRTWTATDSQSNQSSCTQMITVQDSMAPSIVCPANLTIECGTSTAPAATGMATATDNCDTPSQITVTFSDVVTPGTGRNATIARTWMATDSTGNAASCVQAFTVVDSTPPAITCPADVTIECGNPTDPASAGMATATDNCDAVGEITVAFSDVVTPGVGKNSSIARTWTATDTTGNISNCTQTITVEDSMAPVIVCPANLTLECGSPTDVASTGMATATDNCDAVGEITITFADVTTPGNGQNFRIVRTWTATDTTGNQAMCTQTITVEDSIAPVIVCPADVTIECDTSSAPAATGMATATDNCDDPGVITVTFSDVSTPGVGKNSTITRTWEATDTTGNMATCAQTITVQDTVMPVIVCPADVTIECDQSSAPANTGMATATDNCDTPGEITIAFTDVNTPGTGRNFTIARTWTATDTTGNLATCVQTITVVDSTPPAIICPADVTIECGNPTDPASAGLATAIDNCDAVGEITITFSDVVTPGTGRNFVIARTWTATDTTGNRSNCTQTITVRDSIAPVIICPANVTVECDTPTGPSATGMATATDNCDDPGEITIAFTDVITPGIGEDFSIARTWTATDTTGNQSMCTQTITVEDTMVPVITLVGNATVAVEAGTSFTDPGATVADICDDNPSLVVGGDTVDPNVPAVYTITYDSMDSSGNPAVRVTRTVTVADTIPPEITLNGDATITLTANIETYIELGASATDSFDTNVPVVVGGDVVDSTRVGVYRVTYTAQDDAGNMDMESRTVNVLETPAFALTATDANKAEGDAENSIHTFTVTRTGTVTAAGSVDYAVQLTGLLNSEDFSGAISGTVPFAVNETTRQVTISVTGDLVVEASEGYTVALSNALPTGAGISAASASGTIVNDDQAVITVAFSDANEGDAGDSETGSYSITTDLETDVDVTVDIAVTGGTATDGTDFSLNAASLTITAGETSASSTYEIIEENIAESDETIEVSFSNISATGRNVIFAGSLASVSDGGSILNDDFAPVANIDGTYGLTMNGSLVVPVGSGVLANDTDADDGNGPANLTVTQVTDDVDNGILTLAADGSFTYTVDPMFSGEVRFTYEVSDGTNTSTAEAVINVAREVDIMVGIDVLQTPLVAGGDALDTFRVGVRNDGPADAMNIVITQSSVLPAGVTVVSAIPGTGTFLNGVWSLDLAAGASSELTFKLQADATASEGSGVIPLAMELTSVDQFDTQPSNNAASATASVISVTETELTITSSPAVSNQSGLLVASVTVTNDNAEAAPGFRLRIGNLPGDVTVFNASGTDGGVAYVLFNQPLAPGASVTLSIEFQRASLVADFTPQYTVELLPFQDTVPAALVGGITPSRMLTLANGDFLLEIPSMPGTTYGIEYSDDMVSWTRVVPDVFAPHNRLQWIDNGPSENTQPSVHGGQPFLPLRSSAAALILP